MVNYIVQVATGIIASISQQEKWCTILPHSEALFEELYRLDPRDFLPESRYEFIIVRLDVECWNKNRAYPPGAFLNGYISDKQSQAELRVLMERVVTVLNKYGGEGWRAITRSFSFLKDKGLREIIERDYKELTLVLFPGGAWKSTVIIAGSILEAILSDVLTDPKRVASTNASTKGARARGGVPIDIAVDPESWKLTHLIEVAVDIGVLPSARADTIDQVLRDYRNFVHPQKEKKAKHDCSEAEAGLAKYALDGVCNHLEKTL